MRSKPETLAAICLVLALTGRARAGVALSPPSPAQLAPDPLGSLAWMAGDWEGDDDGMRNEERWTEPAGGMMLAVHRDVKAGKAVSFEFLRIESTPGGIVYYASPRGKAPTPFRKVEGGVAGARSVTFENPEIEFPRRILYWMEKDGELRARIEGTSGGKPKSFEWAWRKRKTRG